MTWPSVVPPGLDPALIAAALPSRRDRAARVLPVIEEHLRRHDGFVTWSGGRDSTAVVALARQVRPHVPVVWYDSGLEYPETHAYIRGLAESLKLNLYILKAEPSALEILALTGAWDHGALYRSDVPDLHDALIVGPAAKAGALFGAGELTGLRAEESVGRRVLLARADGHYRRANGTEVFAPIWAWSGLAVRGLLAAEQIPANPVYARLAQVGAPERAQRVGLVVDGNNAENGRFTYLRAGWPDLWAELCAVLPRLAEWR